MTKGYRNATHQQIWQKSPGHVAWIISEGIRTEIYTSDGDAYSARYYSVIDLDSGYRHGDYFCRASKLPGILPTFEQVTETP